MVDGLSDKDDGFVGIACYAKPGECKMWIYGQTIICKTFDIWLWLRDLRISWARIFWGQLPTETCRIAEATLHIIKGTLDFSLLGLVHILLIICDHSLRKSLTNSVDLCNVSSTSDSNSDVKILEALETQEEDGFEDLDSEGLGLEQFDGGSVDSKDSLAGFDGSHCDCVFLSAEALDDLVLCLGHGLD